MSDGVKSHCYSSAGVSSAVVLCFCCEESPSDVTSVINLRPVLLITNACERAQNDMLVRIVSRLLLDSLVNNVFLRFQKLFANVWTLSK